eukprot:7647786-Prorocentrum_lima.AAC.1
MTSSLVGSEMCIRDSTCSTDPRPSALARMGSRPWSLSGLGQQELAVLPVSYTHLTLPTICSV